MSDKKSFSPDLNSNKDNSEKTKPTFDEFVNIYGLSRAVAAGVKAKIKLPASQEIDEDKFLQAVKKFTSQVAR